MIPSALSPDNIKLILNKIQPYINKTPFIKASTKLDEFFSTNMYFKCEFLQKSGSFKARGAINNIISQDKKEFFGLAIFLDVVLFMQDKIMPLYL